jgi:hypothetical protein
MQKLWPFYRDIKFFCKKHQNPCLLFFLLTRSHNITKSNFFNFLQTFYHFLLFFRRLKRRPTGGVCVCVCVCVCVWRVKKCLKIFPPTLWMAHIYYAPLIWGLLVAHIIYAPRISLTVVRPVGPRWGPHIINGAYFLICATNRENISGAYNKCATDKTWYFVDVGPTWILVAHSDQHAPLVVKLSVEHIHKYATSKY